MSKQDLTRQEEFKRATAGALRAVAHAVPEFGGLSVLKVGKIWLG